MSNTTTLEPESTITFEIIPATAGIAPEKKLSLERSFLPSFQELERLKGDADKAATPQEARIVRLELVKVRTGADKVRKELKEASLREGRAIDGANAILINALLPIEKAMDAIEKEAERKEQARIAALVADRTERLQAVGGIVPSNLSVLTDDQFSAILSDAAELQRIKLQREAREEADRLAKIEADRLERLRIEEENAKLKAEAEEAARLAKIEADRIAAERAEEQRRAKEEAEKREAAFAAERAKAEEAARVERDKLELARRQAEAEAAMARKQAEDAAAKAKAEADAIAAERAKERAAEEAKLKAERAAAAKAAKAPDNEKIMAFLASFKSLSLPIMATPDGEQALAGIKTVLNRAYGEIKAISENL